MDQIILLHLGKFYYTNNFKTVIQRLQPLFRIYRYSATATAQAAYIIGGYTDTASINIIAEFRNNQWSNIGSLTRARDHHGSITVGDLTMVIGGYGA